MTQLPSFKILPSKDKKQVLVKGVFSEYPDYQKLKNRIIDASDKVKGFKIKENDNFKLIFVEENDDFYIPSQLKNGVGIGNQKSYNYFTEKLVLRGIKGKCYKFYVEKMKRPYKFKEKENSVFMKEALDASWQPIYDNIIKDVNLSKLEESQVEYNKMKEQLKKNEEKINKEVHKNIICNNCFKNNIKGKRFVCAECNNYNLCQDCEKIYYQKQIHQREHTLIQVNKALDDDINKYNNVIGNTTQIYKNVPSSFPIEFSVVNSGENDLKDCYILPVRYGEEYLSCSPKKITDSVIRNMPIKINLVVRVPDEKGYFEGYFRMFTPNGLPFGNTLCIKVLNGE